jgi:hypothetical protein
MDNTLGFYCSKQLGLVLRQLLAIYSCNFPDFYCSKQLVLILHQLLAIHGCIYNLLDFCCLKQLNQRVHYSPRADILFSVAGLFPSQKHLINLEYGVPKMQACGCLYNALAFREVGIKCS